MSNSYINSNTNIFQRSAKPVGAVSSSKLQPKQLSLFKVITKREDPPPYPLQIVSIPDRERVRPQWNCLLVHYESGLKLGGQFTYDEAKKILQTTRYWDFTLIEDRMPRCRHQLLSLLERICRDRQSYKDREVAA